MPRMSRIIDGLKFCGGCSEQGLDPWKPITAFAKRSNTSCGVQSRCRDCCNAVLREKRLDPAFVAKNRVRELEWLKNNPKKNLENTKRWASNNPEKAAQTKNNYHRRKYKKDPNFRLRQRLRCRLHRALRGKARKAGSAVRDLGCSIEELRKYLETKFYSRMAWENHGTYWELDHIQPLFLFNLTDRKQFLTACRYTNLQPLTIEDHRKKTKKDAAHASKSQ